MSHAEQRGFFQAVADANRALIEGASVLEIGSYDVNGSLRTLFAAAREYTGVDLTPGPGVDLVSYGHEVAYPDASFDITISGECFEHDPHWQDTFVNMVRMTKPGGLVVVSCASVGRPEHGTTRTDRADSPGTQSLGLDYYRNLTAADFAGLGLEELFSKHRFWYLPTHFDLYFVGAKAGDTSVAFPPDEAISQLRALMTLSDRLVRVPMRLLAHAVSPERYQSIVLPVWSRLPAG